MVAGSDSHRQAMHGAVALRAAGMPEHVIGDFGATLLTTLIVPLDNVLLASDTFVLTFGFDANGVTGSVRIWLPPPTEDARAWAVLPDALRVHEWRFGAKWPAWKHSFNWNPRKQSWEGKAERETTNGAYKGSAGFAWWNHPELVQFAEGAAALWFLGKLADAYVSRLADRLAESTFKAARRISYSRKRRRRHVKILLPSGTTTVIIPDPFPDIARVKFIDLDPGAKDICGKTLCWDPKSEEWVVRK